MWFPIFDSHQGWKDKMKISQTHLKEPLPIADQTRLSPAVERQMACIRLSPAPPQHLHKLAGASECSSKAKSQSVEHFQPPWDLEATSLAWCKRIRTWALLAEPGLEFWSALVTVCMLLPPQGLCPCRVPLCCVRVNISLSPGEESPCQSKVPANPIQTHLWGLKFMRYLSVRNYRWYFSYYGLSQLYLRVWIFERSEVWGSNDIKCEGFSPHKGI